MVSAIAAWPPIAALMVVPHDESVAMVWRPPQRRGYRTAQLVPEERAHTVAQPGELGGDRFPYHGDGRVLGGFRRPDMRRVTLVVMSLRTESPHRLAERRTTACSRGRSDWHHRCVVASLLLPMIAD